MANTGIAGQGSNSGVAIPGGLLRQNSATNGRGAPYKPYSLSLMDSVSIFRGSHFFKVGGEFRMVRMRTRSSRSSPTASRPPSAAGPFRSTLRC